MNPRTRPPVRPAIRRRRAVVSAALALVVVGAGWVGSVVSAPAAGAAPCVARAGQVRVAVVVDFGTVSGSTGGVSQVCVPVDQASNGYDLLAARAQQLGTPAPRYRGDGLLCSIDGFPATECTANTSAGTRYWAYYLGTGSGWAYSQQGAGTRRMSSDVVEGWRFVDGPDSADEPPPRGPSVSSAICQSVAPPPSTAPGGVQTGEVTGSGSGAPPAAPAGTSTSGAAPSGPTGDLPAPTAPPTTAPFDPNQIVTAPSLPTASSTTTTVPVPSSTATPDRTSSVSSREAAARRKAPNGAGAVTVHDSGGGGGLIGPLAVGLAVVALVLAGVVRSRRHRGHHAA